MDEKIIRDYLQQANGIMQEDASGCAHADVLETVQIRCFDSLDSTNAYAKNWVKRGIRLPALVLADAQTQGRGRLGRSFFSPPGGLYMSMAVECKGIHPGMLTTLAAVSVLEAAQAMQLPSLHIKWVNDILLQGKKIGGILAEGITSRNAMDSAVIGIGLNTTKVQFPLELQRSAGSLAGGQLIQREKLAAFIFFHFFSNLPNIPRHMASYRENCINIGKQVRFEQGERCISATVKMWMTAALCGCKLRTAS